MPMFHPFRAPDPAENPFGLAAAVGLGIVAPEVDGERRPVSADPDMPSAAAWLDGYEVRGPACSSTRVAALLGHCEPGADQAIAHGPGSWDGFDQSVKGMPFAIQAGVECSSLSFRTRLEDYRREADRRLRLCRWGEFAHELWTGDLAQAEIAKVVDGGGDAEDSAYFHNRRLAHPDAIELNQPGGESPVEALSLLEDAYGTCTCGGGRVVHVPIRAVAYLKEAGLVTQQGQRMFGPAGEFVVTDDGYTGSGPDGTMPDPGQVWIYGTTTIYGEIEAVVRHPEVTLEDAFDALTNQFFVRAEHYAMATWLCCHFAVLVNLEA